MTSRRDFLQQVACAFAVAGVGCTVAPQVFAEPELPRVRIAVPTNCVGVVDPKYLTDRPIHTAMLITYFIRENGESFDCGNLVCLNEHGRAVRWKPEMGNCGFVGVCFIPEQTEYL